MRTLKARSNWAQAVTIAGAALAAVAFTGQPAQAALISFTDVTAWQTAVGGGTLTENFNSFAVDTEFRTTSVALNNMLVSGTTGANGTATQKIDANPQQFPGFYNIDGTTYLLADLTGTEYVRFDFLSPVVAWGAMTSGLADGGPTVRNTEIQVYDAANVLLGTIFPSSSGAGNDFVFYGFQLTSGAAAYLLFTDNDVLLANDVFGIDNIQFQAVPEPATLLLLGTGLGAVAARRRRAKRA